METSTGKLQLKQTAMGRRDLVFMVDWRAEEHGEERRWELGLDLIDGSSGLGSATAREAWPGRRRNRAASTVSYG